MKELFKKSDDINISPLLDPFSANKIDSISIVWSKGWFSQPASWTARVSFKNGDTTGSQKFEHEDFNTIMGMLKTFLEEL